MAKNKYRKDIDGLRAIAVFAVIIYHANITINGSILLPGGYIGVDIFFVISGYLISKIILEELYNKQFSLPSFYERRIRRLLPALFFVSIMSLILGWFTLLPETYLETSKSLIAAILFSSNFYFYITGLEYDAWVAMYQPFLHTWSLSVEEQFYLIFPIFLLFLIRIKRPILVVLIILLISVTYANYVTNENPSLSFYLIFTRAFELLAGTLIVMLEQYKKRINIKWFYKIFPKIGILLIFISFFMFDHKTNHPSFITLIPVFATTLIIFFNNEREMINKVLSIKPIVMLGLISYSLYLWHYPIFVMVRETNLNSGLIYNDIIIGICILAISFLTYRYIEKPFRNKSNFSRKQIFLSAAFGGLIIIIISFTIVICNGFTQRVPDILKFHFDSNAQHSSNTTKQDGKICINRKSNFCEFDQSNEFENNIGNIFLLGDSHLGVIQEDLRKKLNNIGYKTTIMTSTGCIYLPDMNLYDKNNFEILDTCSKQVQNHKKETILESENSLALVHGRYSLYLSELHFNNFEGGVEGGERMGFFSARESNFEDKEARIENMKNTINRGIEEFLENDVTVILVYPVPEVGWHVPKEIWKRGPKNNKLLSDWLASNPISTSLDRYNQRNKDIIKIFDSFTKKNIIRIKPSEIFCSTSANRCFTHNEKLIYYNDDDHLSYEGGKILNNEIINKIEIYLNALQEPF